MKGNGSNSMAFVCAAATATALVLTSGCGYFRQVRDDVPMVSAPAVAREQTLNPEAKNNTKVVAGLDAGAAQNVQKTYVQSFQREDTGRAVETFVGLGGIGD